MPMVAPRTFSSEGRILILFLKMEANAPQDSAQGEKYSRRPWDHQTENGRRKVMHGIGQAPPKYCPVKHFRALYSLLQLSHTTLNIIKGRVSALPGTSRATVKGSSRHAWQSNRSAMRPKSSIKLEQVRVHLPKSRSVKPNYESITNANQKTVKT